MASGTPDRRPTKPNGSTPQPGPSNLAHQPHYAYGVPQYMTPYPMQHMPPAQMYSQHPHMQSYPPYGYQQPMYQHPGHPPQGYPAPPMHYMPHMPAPHPHYPSPNLAGPYQHPSSPWSPGPPSMPPNDPGMSTPPVYATPYAPPPPMHHGGQTLYQSSQSFAPRNVPPSPSGSGFRHLASPRPNPPQIRSPSHQYARIPDQSHVRGSASGSPSGHQMNQSAPLPSILVDQQNEAVAVVTQSPKVEPPTVVDEPIPTTISSPPSQPPPQPPPPPAEEVKMEAPESVQDDAIRFSGGRIPTPNAESVITFAAPLSIPSSSPPPLDVGKGNVPPESSERAAGPSVPPTFTSAPIFNGSSKNGASTNNAPTVPHSPSSSVSQTKGTPVTQFSIAKRRPQVTDAPALSFSRRAKIPASVAAVAVPLPEPPKPVVKLPVVTPAPAAPVKSANVSTPKTNAKGSGKVDAGKVPSKGQKPDAAKPPAPSSIAPSEPSSATVQPASETAAPAADTPAPAPAPAPAPPPVKQPPKSWAALLRPATPVKSAKPTQTSAQKPTGTAPAKPATDTEPKVNGHANGIFEPLPTNAPLHVILGEGAKPYSAHSQVTQPRGLINAGNMCFANVVMQALVYSAPFVRLFETLAQMVPGNLSGKTALYEATILFLREFPPQTEEGASAKSKPRSGTSTPIGPEQTRPQAWNENPFFPELLYEAMKQNKRFDSMQRGHQEDAEEFLGFFLDTLHEELLTMLSRVQTEPAPAGTAWTNGSGPAGNSQAGDNTREVQRPVSPDHREEESGWLEVGKKNRAAVTRTTRATESAITRIFGGKLRSVLQTPGSKDSSDNVRTIEDALRNITVPETVSVYSEARGGQVDAKKQVTLDTLPPLLILHLKRLVYDTKGIQKNSKVIGYPTTLEIRPEIISPTRRTNKSIKYHLYGVVYHHGKHATGGHYTIDALRQDHSEWVRIDDTHIESITEKDVTAHEKHAKLDKTAYLLFYRREPDNSK